MLTTQIFNWITQEKNFAEIQAKFSSQCNLDVISEKEEDQSMLSSTQNLPTNETAGFQAEKKDPFVLDSYKDQPSIPVSSVEDRRKKALKAFETFQLRNINKKSVEKSSSKDNRYLKKDTILPLKSASIAKPSSSLSNSQKPQDPKRQSIDFSEMQREKKLADLASKFGSGKSGRQKYDELELRPQSLFLSHAEAFAHESYTNELMNNCAPIHEDMEESLKMTKPKTPPYFEDNPFLEKPKSDNTSGKNFSILHWLSHLSGTSMRITIPKKKTKKVKDSPEKKLDKLKEFRGTS